MNEAKHTPTPWVWWTSNSHYRLTGADGRDGGVISASIAADGMAVVNVRPDDAAFIVKAVNSHEQLVAALRDLFDRFKQLCDSGDAGNWSLEDTEEGKAAIAALAEAGAA